jgi:two-component sensor histidine kinase
MPPKRLEEIGWQAIKMLEDFASYLRRLASYLTQSYRGKSDNATIQVDAEDIMLDIDTAIPCGLIVNELVSNSLKYEFPENRLGHIMLTCHQTTAGNYLLTVSDDGIGLPTAFDITKTPSLGLKLVISLVNQLEGKLDVYGDQGTTFWVSFGRMTYAEG